MHCVSWPIRADCLSEEGALLKTTCLREAGHRGPTKIFSIWKRMCFLNIKSCQHILLHQIHKIMIFKIASYDPFKSAAVTWLVHSVQELHYTECSTHAFLQEYQHLIKNQHSDSMTLTLENIAPSHSDANSTVSNANAESIWVIVFHVNENALRLQKILNQFRVLCLIEPWLSKEPMFSLLPASNLYGQSACMSIWYIPLSSAQFIVHYDSRHNSAPTVDQKLSWNEL